MQCKKSIRKLALMGLLGVPALLVACSSGVPQADLDAAKQQLASEQQKSAALQQQLSAKIQEAADAQKGLADAKKGVILAAKSVPPPTPRPTPTPPPPGFTPPPPPVPPASFTQALQLYIYADTVTSGAGESKYNIDATATNAFPLCVQTSVFKRGMHMVWRWEVVDTATGKRLTTNEIDTAVVRLPTGEEIKGRFGRHGSTADAPWFWTGAWDVPLDYPLGVLDWTINAKAKDGKTGTFALWKVSIPERGIESRTQIID